MKWRMSPRKCNAKASVPLLIGGATTSRVHTAVKIAPNYPHPVVWVKDASRGVGVASNLLSTDLRADFVSKVHAEYEEVRARHKGKPAGPTPAGHYRVRGLSARRAGTLRRLDTVLHHLGDERPLPSHSPG